MEMQVQDTYILIGMEQAERVYSVLLLEKEFPAMHNELVLWYKRVELEPFPLA